MPAKASRELNEAETETKLMNEAQRTKWTQRNATQRNATLCGFLHPTPLPTPSYPLSSPLSETDVKLYTSVAERGDRERSPSYD